MWTIEAGITSDVGAGAGEFNDLSPFWIWDIDGMLDLVLEVMTQGPDDDADFFEVGLSGVQFAGKAITDRVVVRTLLDVGTEDIFFPEQLLGCFAQGDVLQGQSRFMQPAGIGFFRPDTLHHADRQCRNAGDDDQREKKCWNGTRFEEQ